MEQIINKLRDEIGAVKNKGITSVTIESLENFLNEVESNSSPSFEHLKMANDIDMNNAKLQNDVKIALQKVISDHAIEMFKSVLTSANNAVKACMIINGGAALSLLTFIGKLATETKPQNISPYAFACIAFCTGLAFSALAASGTYFSQYYFGKKFDAEILKNRYPDNEKENYSQKEKNAELLAYVFRWLTIIFVVLAFASFIVGVYQSYFAFIETNISCT